MENSGDSQCPRRNVGYLTFNWYEIASADSLLVLQVTVLYRADMSTSLRESMLTHAEALHMWPYREGDPYANARDYYMAQLLPLQSAKVRTGTMI